MKIYSLEHLLLATMLDQTHEEVLSVLNKVKNEEMENATTEEKALVQLLDTCGIVWTSENGRTLLTSKGERLANELESVDF
jgi:hypothetical protein